jgi:hypothetical protein
MTDPIPLCDDDYLFALNECEQCQTEGREIHGFLYDDENDCHFCSLACQQEWLLSRVNEDDDELDTFALYRSRSYRNDFHLRR